MDNTMMKQEHEHDDNSMTNHERRIDVSNASSSGDDPYDVFDIAIEMMKDRPELASKVHLLKILALKAKAINHTRIIKSSCTFFGVELQLYDEGETDALKLLKLIWNHARTSMSIYEIKDMGILFAAVESGNTRFIVELLRTYPDLMLVRNEDGLTIFHVAVMHRHHGIYNLLYEIGDFKNDICSFNDNEGNNMLHLVGKSSKEMAAKTSRASLLMQRELLWFADVSDIMPPYMTFRKNEAGQTPYALFTKENEDLVSNGLKPMKDCMVVATLIVTVAFAAAFTVPGGYKEDNGLPFFSCQPAFLVFVIADAISLFSSSTSLLVFLSILISHHEQLEFFKSLPTKLMIALLTLFISIAAMMVTFSVSFFVLYHKRLKWVPLLITTFAAVPVIVFGILQSPLLVDLFRSMYDSHYLFNPKKPMLYTKKPRLHSNNSTYRRFPSIIKRINFKK